MPDHPAEFLKQEKPESASQSFFQLQSSNTEKFLGGGKGPRALTPILPPQIAIPPLTLPPQHFWVGPENTNILLWHSLSQLKPAAVSPQPWPHPNAQVHLGAFFGGKKPPSISHQTGVCACRRVSGKVQWSELAFPDPTALFVLHRFFACSHPDSIFSMNRTAQSSSEADFKLSGRKSSPVPSHPHAQ